MVHKNRSHKRALANAVIVAQAVVQLFAVLRLLAVANHRVCSFRLVAAEMGTYSILSVDIRGHSNAFAPLQGRSAGSPTLWLTDT